MDIDKDNSPNLAVGCEGVQWTTRGRWSVVLARVEKDENWEERSVWQGDRAYRPYREVEDSLRWQSRVVTKGVPRQL